MRRDEFRMGREFWCDGRKWLCTDVGRRVVTAICLSNTTAVTVKEGTFSTKAMSYEEAVAYGWFDGPPYGVVEQVFDEDAQEICSKTPDDL